jgi:PTS system mannose-specific IIA component
MIGTLVITHGCLAEELIRAAEMIKGEQKGILAVSVDATKGLNDIKKEITSAVKKVDQGMGVLILTDLFGGTPSNISLSFLQDKRIEVVTGVNLPMLLKLSDLREETDLYRFAETIRTYGIKNIHLASEILSRKAPD